MATQAARKPPSYGNSMFDHGVLSGISWFHYDDTPNVPPDYPGVFTMLAGGN